MKRTLIKLEEVADFDALTLAAHRAFKGSRTRSRSRAGLNFILNIEDEVISLRRALLSGTYRPGEFRHFWICDRKPRFISAAPFCDRVVHHSLTALMSPRLERYADPHSYACRPQRGLHKAVRYAQTLTRRHPWALRLDIAHYFETLPHPPLKVLLRRLFKGDPALRLADLFIDHAPIGCESGRGLPIGNLTSQHFANLYLSRLDHAIRRDLGVSGYLRYMDDLTLFGPDKKTLWRAHEFIKTYLHQQLDLQLKESVTQVTPTRRGVPLLGFRIFPTHVRFDPSRLRRYRHRRRVLDQRWRAGEESDRLRAQSEALGAWASVADTFNMRRAHTQRLNMIHDHLPDP
jgi:RNA-directed DNA polymerase